MQISVSIKGMDGAKAMISGQSRQIPFATSLAINAVAKSIDDEQLGITLPDLEHYCDRECAADWEMRQRAEKLRGKPAE